MDAAIAVPRVKKFLGRRFEFIKGLLRKHVVDPRDNRGKRRDYMALLHALFAALLCGCKTLREAEELTESLYIPDGLRKSGKSGRIPDTTLYEFCAKLEWRQFTPVLVQQLRSMNRKGELDPQGLPCGVVVVDGKSLGKLLHDAGGTALRQSTDSGDCFYHVRVLRSVLASSSAKVCLGMEHIGAQEGEITAFPRHARWLWETYGRYGLFDIFDVDAGFLSRANFEFVDQELQVGLIAALKANQPDLHREARRVLLPLRYTHMPEAESNWESYQGKQIRRRLYRTGELNDFLGWKNLRQVWLVVQETRVKIALTDEERRHELKKQERRRARGRTRTSSSRLLLPSIPTIPPVIAAQQASPEVKSEGTVPQQQSPDKKQWDSKKGRKAKKKSALTGSQPSSNTSSEQHEQYCSEDGWLVTVELRLFVTNISYNRLSPAQILLTVRNHWGVENDCFHSLDVQWKEDAPALCSAGHALLSLGMVRILAYNFDQQLRKRHLRRALVKRDGSEPLEWKRLFKLVTEALKLLGVNRQPALAAPEPTAGSPPQRLFFNHIS